MLLHVHRMLTSWLHVETLHWPVWLCLDQYSELSKELKEKPTK
jgi:hypothetical protein